MITMQVGERWICSNAACRCELVVMRSGRTGEGANPRCFCGSRMKKRYTAPVFREIRQDEAKNSHERF
jgi:hypothetical protein